jgi:hypothetical protein
MMSSFVERAAAQAADIKLARVVLTVLAAPFYLLGLLAGVVVVVVVVAVGAVKLGVADVRSRAERSPAAVPDGSS